MGPWQPWQHGSASSRPRSLPACGRGGAIRSGSCCSWPTSPPPVRGWGGFFLAMGGGNPTPQLGDPDLWRTWYVAWYFLGAALFLSFVAAVGAGGGFGVPQALAAVRLGGPHPDPRLGRARRLADPLSVLSRAGARTPPRCSPLRSCVGPVVMIGRGARPAYEDDEIRGLGAGAVVRSWCFRRGRRTMIGRGGVGARRR